VPVKPIDRFLNQWDAMRERLRTSAARTRVAVVGGGAGGVELILAVEYRLRTLLAQEERSAAHFEYHLFTDGDAILTTHNRPTRSMFQRIRAQRGIVVHARVRRHERVAESAADEGRSPPRGQRDSLDHGSIGGTMARRVGPGGR
jgi:selenide,water dikinase